MSAAAGTVRAAGAARSLRPPTPPGLGRGALLSLLAHALLLAALAFAVNWRSHAPQAVSAELWAAVPQAAAPREVPPPAPPPAPAPAPPPAPVAKTAAPPAPPPATQASAERDAQIAIEQARKREQQQREQAERDRLAREQAEREKAEREKAERDKAERVKAEREQAARDKAEREEAAREKAARDKAQRDQAAREQAARDKAAQQKAAQEQAAREKAEREAQAKAEAQRLEQQRQRNLERMLGQAGVAGATGAAGATGSAQRDAGPSASYAGKLIARVKPNIVLTDPVSGQPAAVVEVRAAPGGTILSRRLVKSSGNQVWDDAVLRAIDRTAELPRDADGRVPPVVIITFTP